MGALKRAQIVGKSHVAIEGIVKAAGFQAVSSKPDFVISLGGDGTLLYAERILPGIPKLCIRANRCCAHCSKTMMEGVERHLPSKGHLARESFFRCANCLSSTLEKVAKGKYLIQSHAKLEATARNGKRIIARMSALNEVQIHNNHHCAVRLAISQGRKVIAARAVGDGAVIATPFGSTAYFNAISRQSFSSGFGIAFSNPVTPIPPVFLKSLATPVKLTLLGREGLLICDNNPAITKLSGAAEVTVKEDPVKARIIAVK